MGRCFDATERDLARFDKRLPGIADTTLAANALTLAERCDSPKTSTTSLSMATRELREHMATLEAQLPAEEKPNRLTAVRDSVHSRRPSRPSRKPAAKPAVAAAR